MPAPLTIDAVLSAADRAVPANDLPTLPERVLPALLDSINGQARLNELGQVAAQAELAHAIATHRDVAFVEEQLQAPTPAPTCPVVVCGVPRTGTTVVHSLLGCAISNARAPLAWEISYPTVHLPMISRLGKDSQSAHADAAARLELLDAVSPLTGQMHPMTAGGHDECTGLVSSTLMSLQTLMMFRVPTFADWLLEQDLTEAYRLWSIQLGLIGLSGASDAQWVLKSPLHVLDYRALWSAVPDARIVQVQRDCLGFFTSFLNLVDAARSIFSEDVDPRELGREWIETWIRVFDRVKGALAERTAQIVVIDYNNLVDRPLVALKQALEELGFGAELPLRELESVWIEQRRRHQNYSLKPLGHYGLKADDVRRAFASYLDLGLVSD
jgi:hypothetical protein